MSLDEPTTPDEMRVFRALRRAVYEKMNFCPFPYQFKGIYGIEQTKGRALLADEMGCGKTLQAMGWAALYPERRPVLIVCPATLKFNWADELMKHLGKDSITLSGKKPYKFPAHEYVIINYDILQAWAPTILKVIKPQIAIFDECNYLKNRSAIRTKAGVKLGKKIPYVIGLTGTPIDNRPVELFAQLAMIDSDLFPSFWDFGFRFCAAENKFGRWEFKGASRVKELHTILTDNVMIRRKLADVLSELPGKVRSVLPLEIPMKEYNKAEEDFIEWLDKVDPVRAAKAKNAEAITKIGYLKRLAAKGKVAPVIAWVKEFLDNTDEKLILFGVHHEIMDQLKDAFGSRAVALSGRTKPADKKIAVDRFQNDPKVRVMIGGLKAAGVGLTLTAASTVLFMELGWTPGEHIQAEARASRIGQTKVVKCYYFVARGTLEEKICELIQAKQKIIEAVIDGQEEVKDWNVYSSLIKSIGRKGKK